jgi:hypothetical protein
MNWALALALAAPDHQATLPSRVQRIVLHVPGHPSYDRVDRRFIFLTPLKTQALWKPRFGTHWILWIDGSFWPRHPRQGEPRFFFPPQGSAAESALRVRIAAEAAPVYAHVQGGNSDSVGIEVSHSGRSHDPFPAEQLHSLAWFLNTLIEMSDGRLSSASIVGHKDLDQHPAYVRTTCEHEGCAVYVDDEGRPYRRRVDPPETLFRDLLAEGLKIPRPAGDPDAELLRAEAIPRWAVAKIGR